MNDFLRFFQRHYFTNWSQEFFQFFSVQRTISVLIRLRWDWVKIFGVSAFGLQISLLTKIKTGLYLVEPLLQELYLLICDRSDSRWGTKSFHLKIMGVESSDPRKQKTRAVLLSLQRIPFKERVRKSILSIITKKKQINTSIQSKDVRRQLMEARQIVPVSLKPDQSIFYTRVSVLDREFLVCSGFNPIFWSFRRIRQIKQLLSSLLNSR